MVQSRRQDEVPGEHQLTIEELARSQGTEPNDSVDQLLPPEPLFDDDEHATLLDWLRDLRQAEIA